MVTLSGDGCLWWWPTWVEEDDGPQTAQLCLVHLHVFHFGHQLRQDSADMKAVLGANMESKRRSQQVILRFYDLPIKNRAHPSTVGAAPMNMEACRQQDAVFNCDGAMRERGDEELIPA